MFRNPSDDQLRDLLTTAKRLAIVGASPKPARPAHFVMEYLQGAGYRCVPVRPPGGAELLGETTVASLGEAGPVDLAVVFRAPEHVPGIVAEALAAGVPALWLQDDVVHVEAAQAARDAGLFVVMNDCALRVHQRLFRA